MARADSLQTVNVTRPGFRQPPVGMSTCARCACVYVHIYPRWCVYVGLERKQVTASDDTDIVGESGLATQNFHVPLPLSPSLSTGGESLTTNAFHVITTHSGKIR